MKLLCEPQPGYVREKDEDKYQLVLPMLFRDIALRGSHNDVGHLGRDRGMHILRDRFYWIGPT